MDDGADGDSRMSRAGAPLLRPPCTPVEVRWSDYVPDAVVFPQPCFYPVMKNPLFIWSNPLEIDRSTPPTLNYTPITAYVTISDLLPA